MTHYNSGRRFEYLIRDLLKSSGLVVSRCAASKPWDLTAASTMASYAVECKDSNAPIATAKKEYEVLLDKLKSPNGKMCDFVPLLFYTNTLGNVALYTRAIFFADSKKYRPVFDGRALREVIA